MVGEYFIDLCLSACCSIDKSYPQYKELFTSIYSIFKDYRDNVKKDDQPIEFKNKIDLIYYLSAKKIKEPNVSIDETINKLQGGKFQEFVPILQSKKIELKTEQQDQILKNILSKKKLTDLISGRKDLSTLLDDIDSGNFTDEEDVITKWEKSLEIMYRNMMKIKKIETIGQVLSLDVKNDDFSPIISKLRNTINSVETIRSGFAYLDKNLPSKGWERRRFYMVGGCSGIGKSTFLINVIKNAIQESNHLERRRVYLYITAENLIDETWSRFYCCLTGKPYEQLVSEIEKVYDEAEKELEKTGDKIQYRKSIDDFVQTYKDEVTELLEQSNANVIFKYVQPRRTTLRELETVIESIKNEYGDDLELVCIDYLDLFCSGLDLEIRLEQGLISQEFKNWAVAYNIAMFSATQLNREGYRLGGDADLTQMGESMKKVDNADFVLFLQRAGEGNEEIISTGNGSMTIIKVKMTILKNRNGSTGLSEIVMMPKKRGDISVFNFRIEEMPRTHNSSDDIGGYYSDGVMSF